MVTKVPEEVRKAWEAEERSKEFLSCLGNGKSMVEIESEEEE